MYLSNSWGRFTETTFNYFVVSWLGLLVRLFCVCLCFSAFFLLPTHISTSSNTLAVSLLTARLFRLSDVVHGLFVCAFCSQAPVLCYIVCYLGNVVSPRPLQWLTSYQLPASWLPCHSTSSTSETFLHSTVDALCCILQSLHLYFSQSHWQSPPPPYLPNH